MGRFSPCKGQSGHEYVEGTPNDRESPIELRTDERSVPFEHVSPNPSRLLTRLTEYPGTCASNGKI